MLEAGLLTYSRRSCLPLLKIKSGYDLNSVMELTAAGQLRNYAVFPFNPGQINLTGTKSSANLLNLNEINIKIN